MKLTYKFTYKDKYNKLLELCKISKNLYNQTNFIIKQELKNNNKWMRYNKLNQILKNTKNLENTFNYKLLKAQTSQQILKLIDKNWKSFFEAIKDYKINPKKYNGKPRSPKYLNKNDLYLLIFTNQNSKIKNNKIILYKNIKINIPEYKNKNFSNFQQVRILPLKNNVYEIEIIYLENIKNIELNYNKYASIDFGVNNLITLVTKEQKPLIIDGKVLKSYNQFYNKQKAYLQSIKDKMKINKYTKNMNKLEYNRKNFIKDYLHKTSRIVINYLIENKIGTLAVGFNRGLKTNLNLGKRNNQAFVSIPYSQLFNYLKYKCELVGIKVIETEESYTSKCDSLSLESLEKQESYLGKRVKRGLFQSKIGKLINADVNGALNILRKVLGDSQYVIEIINSGLLFNPVKISPFTNCSKDKETSSQKISLKNCYTF